jgi:Domain of unknown function (DUF4136)
MRFRKVPAITFLAIQLATAAFAQHVAVDYDHAANFRQIKTYSWAKLHTADPIMDNRVKEAIDQELAAKGWSQVSSVGNVALVVVEQTSEREQYDSLYNGFGGRRWGGGTVDETTTVDHYEVGTLIVSMFDGNSKQLIWRGTASGDVSDNSQKKIKSLAKVVQKMFKNFPPKAA